MVADSTSLDAFQFTAVPLIVRPPVPTDAEVTTGKLTNSLPPGRRNWAKKFGVGPSPALVSAESSMAFTPTPVITFCATVAVAPATTSTPDWAGERIWLATTGFGP